MLEDHRLTVTARLLYGALQAVPTYKSGAGQFSHASLSDLVHFTLKAVRQGVRELVQAGWLQAAQANRVAPIHFTLCHPGDAEVEAARRRVEEAPYRGEALMREFLSLLIDSDQFEDDAAPGFLTNPLTDERLQLDRFYPPGVAFEFNGPQHYGPTGRFSQSDADRQRARDYMKLGICVTRGIELVVVHPEDLNLAAMRQKIGSLLPLRDLRAHQPLITLLDRAGRLYHSAAKRGR